ncbi:response regulator [Altericroceibacterium spongiae]|uniref:Response regulator n=1 Tax=Altericroceibacterium spongiae TaxID=2320269 RepID=A0A420EKN1_9SPHN|nr:response regulator [Altericroceibacterium spongiae]RKF21247.1 response regulator [Altericroceibacterium spongiae]
MGRIIYAEDDEIVAQIVIDALMNAGHAVGWLQDGDEALRAMRFRPPDLAILDQNMPVMNGGMVLREMRVIESLVMVPVLMLTAIDAKQSQNIAFYEGADDYMTKPFDPDELVFRAEQLMDQKFRRARPTF